MADNYEIEVTLEETFGTGVRSVEQTVASTESGGQNEITVTLTNDQQNKFYVMNGLKGADGKDGGYPVAVSTMSEMTDTSVVYLYERETYSWNGIAWVSNGTYGAPATYITKASETEEIILDQQGNHVATVNGITLDGLQGGNPIQRSFETKLYAVTGENEDGALTQKATSEAIDAAQFLPVVNYPGSDTSVVSGVNLMVDLKPNKLYKVSGIGTAYTYVAVTLTGNKLNALNRFYMQFTTGGTAVRIVFPSNVVVPSAFSIKTQTRYDIIIEDRVAKIWEDGNAVGDVLDATATAGAVAAWLDGHPEATTTVADGSITTAKLASGVIDANLRTPGAAADAKAVGDELTELKSQISDIEEQIESGASGLTVRIKHALMQLANYVAFKNNDPNAQEYIDELYDSLFEITGIRLNSSSLSFTSLGATQQLTATTTPEGGDVVWTSSDTSIATVDQTGLVTSVAYGSATITATSGSVSATCSVVIATATVTSLSAVYSPSGNVYEGASLDSLKSDLVVTAHWSNGTITAVDDADYSLSGTLVEGANTITVSYGGQTATFNVTVSPVPVYGTFTPDNYVQGYYIESDGTVTASQYGSMSNTYYDVARGVLNFAASANFRVSLYDANKNFIRQVIFTDSGTTGNGAIRSHDAAITFTDDVKYFRLSWSKTTNVEFTITNVEYTDLHMEIGDIDTTTGEDVVQPLRIRSVDYIPVSSTSLVLNNYKPFLDSEFMNSYGFLGRCYDSSKTLVGNISWTTTNKTITLPTGTAFIRPIIQFGNVNIPDDFADYQYIPLLLNSANYRIVKA